MSDHLPECIYHGGNWHTLRPCICDRLRACEARVLAEQLAGHEMAYDAGISDERARIKAAVEAFMEGPMVDAKAVLAIIDGERA